MKGECKLDTLPWRPPLLASYSVLPTTVVDRITCRESIFKEEFSNVLLNESEEDILPKVELSH